MDPTKSFVASTLYNVTFQFSFRIFTFVLNALLLRIITKELLGVANVRLMLLYTTLTFLVREPFRRACLLDTSHNRLLRDKAAKWKSFVNVLWLSPLVWLGVSPPLCYTWLYVLERPDAARVRLYAPCALAYAAAVLLESLAQPFWIVGQQFFFIRLKPMTEGIQVFLRSVVVVPMLLLFPQWQLPAFAVGMVLSSAVYTVIYAGYFWFHLRAGGEKKSDGDSGSEAELEFCGDFRELLPTWSAGFDWSALHLGRSFFAHSLVKQLLTEGERYVMTFLNVLNFADQGVYDMIHNLGSLVARILFAPLEESAYTLFSVSIRRDCAASEQDSEKFVMATRVLEALLKLVTLVGLVVCVFGYAYSYIALHIYGGTVLSSNHGPTLLRWYCLYILLLALNGVTECFAFSAMRKEQVDRHMWWLALFCIGFLAAAWSLTAHFGAVGFLWANCFNMTFRILYSIWFINDFYRTTNVRPLWSLVPRLEICFVLGISWLLTAFSELLFCCDGFFATTAHLAVGGTCFLLTLMIVYTYENDLIDFVRVHVIGRKIKEG